MRVSGIDVLVTVHYRGEAIAVDIGATGQDGVVSGSLDMIRFEPEQDVLLVITAHNNEGATLGQTTVSFKTWY
jgi:hypothetical protein